VDKIVLSDFCERWMSATGWKYLPKTEQILHIKTKRCAQADIFVDDTTSQISLATCDEKSQMQKWIFEDVSYDLANTKIVGDAINDFAPPKTLL